MKKFLFCLISVLFFACAGVDVKPSLQDVAKSQQSKPVVEITTTVEKFQGTDYLIIQDKKSSKAWTMTYKQWRELSSAYDYWMFVSNNKVEILEVKETGDYVVISFGYRYIDKNNPKAKSKTILAGNVFVPKSYLDDKVQKKLEAYKIGVGVTSGIGAASILIIIIMILLHI